MSWSVNIVGKPEAVERAIQLEVAAYGAPSEDNVSRREFAAAAPHLIALAKMTNQAVRIVASGHGTWEGEKLLYGQVDVRIETVGNLAE